MSMDTYFDIFCPWFIGLSQIKFQEMDKEKGEGTGGSHLQSYLLDELFAFWDCFSSLLLGNKLYLVIRHILHILLSFYA